MQASKSLYCTIKEIAKNPFELKSEGCLFQQISKHPHETHEGDVCHKHHPKWAFRVMFMINITVI